MDPVSALTEFPQLRVLGPLTAALAGAKLAGVIPWPWPVVLAPIWVPYGLTAIALGIAVWADHGAGGGSR